MNLNTNKSILTTFTSFFIAVIAVIVCVSIQASAQVQNPQGGGIGIQGEITAPPPTSAPSISTPTNGQVISTIPVEVRGVCNGDLLVKLYKNNVFSGSDLCRNGSYAITIDLFSGRNELVARHVDELDQQGPDSNLVAVTFNDGATKPNVAERITLTSVYARKGANPGQVLSWPVLISGGVAPYAISVDWGDGSLADVYSINIPGEFMIKHTFAQSGVYRALLKATDKNGSIGFLQLTAISNGEVKDGQVAGAIEDGGNRTKIIWQPVALTLPIVATTFYLGKKYEVTRIKRKLMQGEHPFE